MKPTPIAAIASTRNRAVLIFLIAAVPFMVSRLPAIFTGFELNGDESMLMVLGKRMAMDWVPWRAADPSTSGPLNPALFALLAKLGVTLNYHVAHLAAAVLVLSNLTLGWLLGRKLLGEAYAAGALFLVTFWCSALADTDFVHYSSELLPVLLILGGLNLLIDGRSPSTTSVRRLLAGCVLIGAAPWAKLQAVPITAVVFGWLLYVQWFRGKSLEGPAQKPVKELALATLGLVLPTVAILGLCYHYETFEFFWTSYVLSNVAYAGPLSPTQIIGNLSKLAHYPPVYAASALGAFGLILSFRVTAARRTAPALLLVVLLLIGCVFAVVRPPELFGHYLVFLLVPAQLFSGLCLSRLKGRVLAAILTGISVLPVIEGINAHSLQSDPGRNFALRAHRMVDGATGDLRKIIPANASLFVWGWSPSFYLDLPVRPATRYQNIANLVRDTPLTATFRKYLMEDLAREQPDWIMATEWFPLSLAHPMISPFPPELQTLIDTRYQLTAANNEIRVYRRIK